jgi:hypothetical protein
MSEQPRALHSGHHWGSFAKDPWSRALDLVEGRVWEEALRRSSPPGGTFASSSFVRNEAPVGVEPDVARLPVA